MNDIISFTRYLYIKDEVEFALLYVLLNKNLEEALFWAFELYFSGYEEELLNYIWCIYYDFYASTNPTFESYFIKKHHDFLSCDSNGREKIICSLINNLIIRNNTLDVFLLRQMVLNFDFVDDEKPANIKIPFESHLSSRDYISIATTIMETTTESELLLLLTKTIDHFSKEYKSLKKSSVLSQWKKVVFPLKKRVLISRIMYYYSLLDGIKMGKSLYISVDAKETEIYKTIYKNNDVPARKILSCACKYVPRFPAGLFKLSRDIYNETNLKNEYWLYWMYHASATPVWKARVESFQGVCNHVKKSLEFPNDDLLEAFYEAYEYEPDEQAQEIQDKNIPSFNTNNNTTWCDFYETYKKNGIYFPDKDLLCELEKVIY